MWFASDDTQPSRGVAFEQEERARGFVDGLAGWSAFPDTDHRARPLLRTISSSLGKTSPTADQPANPRPASDDGTTANPEHLDTDNSLEGGI